MTKQIFGRSANTLASDRLSYLAFSYFYRIGPINLRRLENYFPDLETAFQAAGGELEKAGLTSKLAGEFVTWRSSFNPGDALRELEKEKINFLTWRDPEYPALLKEIPDPPPLLYYKGRLNGEIKNRLAVVGSRKHSAYAGKTITELLPPLVSVGIEIISGLAMGVDALAHQAALDNKGITLAILGSGLASDNIYPYGHRRLAAEIVASGGALISELPPRTPPYKQNFPRRNRIISGLAQAVLIIEAQAKSGSLITANCALEQNRDVLAVPGNIFSEFSDGPNKIIKLGAQAVTAARDILEVFKIEIDGTDGNKTPEKTASYRPNNETERIVYELIKQADARAEKITTDEIIKKTKLDTATINSTLSILEIKGVAKNGEFGYDLN
ncbi:MAG: DNA-processing protein DprA [Patescibacteria group bacterium]